MSCALEVVASDGKSAPTDDESRRPDGPFGPECPVLGTGEAWLVGAHCHRMAARAPRISDASRYRAEIGVGREFAAATGLAGGLTRS